MPRWVTVLVLSSVLAIHNAQRFAPVSLSEELRSRMGIDYVGFGNLVGAFLISYALCQIPIGLLADRIDNKKLLAVGCSLSLLGSIGFALADSYPLAIAARLVLGFASTLLYIPTVRYIVATFPRKERGSVMGFAETGAGVGQILSLMALPFLTGYMELSRAFFLLPALSALLLAGILVGLRSATASTQGTSGQFGVLVRSGRFRNLIAYQFMGMLAAYAVLVWLPTYLRVDFGFTALQAGSAGSLANLALAVFSPVAGTLSDRLGSRVPVLLGGSILVAFCLSVVLLVHDPTVVMAAAFLAGIGFAFTIPMLMIYVGETFGAVGAGLAVSLNGTTGQIASSLSGPIFGFLLDRGGGFVAVWAVALFLSLGRIPFLLRVRVQQPAAVSSKVH